MLVDTRVLRVNRKMEYEGKDIKSNLLYYRYWLKRQEEQF